MKTATTQILLVEDNPDHAELLRRCLENAGLRAEVYQVEDGEAALDYIFGHKKFSDRSQFPAPDLVLLDLRLPRLDGTEVLKQVKNHHAARSLPVVVLTTSDAEHDLDTAIRLHADRFLTKPVEAPTLRLLLLDFGLLSGPGTAENNPSAKPPNLPPA
jgi:CheY-like chemotaxis protein